MALASLIPPSIARNLPAMVRNELGNLPAQRQEEFIEEFKRKSKSIAVTYLLWLLLGWHYIYLRKWAVQFLYWLTLGGVFIWTFIDLFRIPGMVRDYNKDVATDVLRNLKAISGSAPVYGVIGPDPSSNWPVSTVPIADPRTLSPSDSAPTRLDSYALDKGAAQGQTLIDLPGAFLHRSGAEKGMRISIQGYPTSQGSETTIGRESIQGDRRFAHILLRHPTVSRKQAQLLYQYRQYYLTNLSGTNPTRVNGKVLNTNETVVLSPGDIVQFGEIDLQFVLL